MNNIYQCIQDLAKSKNLTMEQFINESQEYGYSKLKIPLGINGTNVLGFNTIVKGDDIYVPDLEVMTGHIYSERDFKSGRDAIIKKQYNVPDAPIGWWVSEKFDGQRAVWDGEKFISRGGSGNPRVYPYIPRWFKALMPPGIALDGELFIARNSFNTTTSILKTKLKPESQRSKKDPSQQDLDERWLPIKYNVFDIIEEGLYEQRKNKLRQIVNERCKIWKLISIPLYLKKGECPLVFTEQYLIKSETQLTGIYNDLVKNGAEGVMIRAPGIPYIPRRTKLMLKMKLVEDSECIIEGYKPGEGKNKNSLGSFYCKDVFTNNRFYVSGMTDSIRENYNVPGSELYHPPGTIIIYKFYGLTPDGIPRHPVYKGKQN